MRKEIITDGQDEVFVCPHCRTTQAEHPENMLGTDDYSDLECDTCGKSFSLEKYVKIEYITSTKL